MKRLPTNPKLSSLDFFPTFFMKETTYQASWQHKWNALSACCCTWCIQCYRQELVGCEVKIKIKITNKSLSTFFVSRGKLNTILSKPILSLTAIPVDTISQNTVTRISHLYRSNLFASKYANQVLLWYKTPNANPATITTSDFIAFSYSFT